MFCVNCGAAVPDGARFCTSCGKPVAEADASALAAAKEEITFRNIRIMNIVGATGMGIFWGWLIVKFGEKSNLMLAVFSLIFIVMVAAPLSSVLALSKNAGRTLRRIAYGCNIAIIMIWVASLFQGLLGSPSSLIYSIPSALFYVVPPAINLWALTAIGAKAAKQGV